MSEFENEIEWWTDYVESREFQVRNASINHEARLIQLLHLSRNVLDAMHNLNDFISNKGE